MNTSIRRKDRAIGIEESVDILRKGAYGVLSMCSTENEGYGIPMSYAFDNDNIYFHCATEGTKLQYLSNNNKVSFCVVGETTILPSKFGTLYQSVIVFGEIQELEADEKQDALLLLLKKYASDYIDEGIAYINNLNNRVKVLKLSIETITGKSRKR